MDEEISFNQIGQKDNKILSKLERENKLLEEELIKEKKIAELLYKNSFLKSKLDQIKHPLKYKLKKLLGKVIE